MAECGWAEQGAEQGGAVRGTHRSLYAAMIEPTLCACVNCVRGICAMATTCPVADQHPSVWQPINRQITEGASFPVWRCQPVQGNNHNPKTPACGWCGMRLGCTQKGRRFMKPAALEHYCAVCDGSRQPTGCVLPVRCPWVRFCWAAWSQVADRGPHHGFRWAAQGGRLHRAE